MNEITGIYIPCLEGGIPAASEMMRRVFCELRERGILHRQILYPYSDDLLLTGRLPGMFGTHALLCDVPGDMIKDVLLEIAGEKAKAESINSVIERSLFLYRYQALPPGTVKLGSITSLAAGTFSAWAIRQHSRRLCSFAEHMTREGKYPVLGYSGDALIVEMDDWHKIEDTNETVRVNRLLMEKTGM